MKDMVVMSKANGALAVAVPLFRVEEFDAPDSGELEYKITMNVIDQEPLAFVIDIGYEARVLGASWVYENLEFLGDL